MPEDERDKAHEYLGLLRQKVEDVREDLEKGLTDSARRGAVLVMAEATALYEELDRLADAQEAREGQS